MKKRKHILVLAGVFLCIGCISACSSSNKTEISSSSSSVNVNSISVTKEKDKYADDSFMKSLERGLENRWNLSEAIKEDAPVSEQAANFKKCVAAEYDPLIKYENATFENKKLGKYAKEYIDTIKETREIEDTYGSDSWSMKYNNGIYQFRVAALYKINKIRPLEISDKYQTIFKSMLSEGETSVFASSILKKAKFKLKDESYGQKTYAAVVENTSSNTFDYFSLVVKLKDKDGVVVDTQEPNTSKWTPGTKTRFEFTTDKKFKTISVEYAEWS
jgi:hypothetical protein